MSSEMGTSKAAEVTLSTEGKQLIWVVFDNDGCECSNLVGVFAIEKDAISCRDNIEAAIRRQYVHMNKTRQQLYPQSSGTTMEWMGSVEVECREMGQINLPADAAPPVAERISHDRT